mgnify:CR=1 FL=1
MNILNICSDDELVSAPDDELEEGKMIFVHYCFRKGGSNLAY